MIKKFLYLKRFFALAITCIAFFFCFANTNFYKTSAHCLPFYNLCPKPIVLRANFSTCFNSSSEERKHNISLAVRSLDKTFIDVGAEFSFNKVVGARTTERGYKTSKVIVDGNFVNGVGGGVCQVSTTLYNALLLAGLKITEYHPHSLPVSYVEPSFDAMVSYGWSDLRFINNTKNPVIIHAFLVKNQLNIEIYGEKSEYSFVRESVVTETIPEPEYLFDLDQLNQYPDLYEGQQKIVRYGKPGLKSNGYILTYKNGKLVSKKLLRKDSYNAIQGLVVIGKTPYPNDNLQQDNENTLHDL